VSAQSRLIAELSRRVSELERRHENGIRHGTVRQVDAKKGLVRLAIGKDADGTEQLSPWVRYAQHAGDYKFHNPPSVGQTLTLLSPAGDFAQAVALQLTWSDKNPSPSDKPDEHVITFGDLKITRRQKEMILEVGATKIHFRPDNVDALHVSVGNSYLRLEKNLITALTQHFKHSGDVVEHDGFLIDKTHKHIEVMSGPDITGIPISGGGSG
jgi:phage baseplate assembly protein gpV